MKITITRDAGVMVVGDDARPVDMSLLPEGIEAVFYNTDTGKGFIQYDEVQEEEVEDRDLEEEERQNRELALQNKRPLEEPIMRRVRIRKRPREIIDFAPFVPLYDQWEAYVPPPPPPPDPKLQELLQERETDKADTMGQVEPKTLQELSDMTRAQLRAWFDANVTTDNQLRRVVRWLFIYLVRRL